MAFENILESINTNQQSGFRKIKPKFKDSQEFKYRNYNIETHTYIHTPIFMINLDSTLVTVISLELQKINHINIIKSTLDNFNVLIPVGYCCCFFLSICF